jgi:hypothetical protein
LLGNGTDYKMNSNIQYRLLDANCILRRCLHAGPIPLQETDPVCDVDVAAETQAHVPRGTVDRFLKALCEHYGAYGIAAVDGDMVVGQVRFYPSALGKMMRTTRGVLFSACVQEHDQVQAMGQGFMALTNLAKLSAGFVQLIKPSPLASSLT